MVSRDKFKTIIQYLSLLSLAAYLSLHVIEVNISPVFHNILIIFPFAVIMVYIGKKLIRNNVKSYLLILCLLLAGLTTVYLLYAAPARAQQCGAVLTLLSSVLSSVSIGISIAKDRKS